MNRKILLLTIAVIYSAVTTLFVSSCKKEDPEPPKPVATLFQLVTGGSQSAFAGSALLNPVEVLVKDQDGIAFAGAKVTFAVAEGSVSAPNVTTNSQGKASVTWTLGPTVGTQTLIATAYQANGTTPLNGSPITVNATANAEVMVATSIELVSGGDQSAGTGMALENDIKVIVKDQNGNAFRNADVNFAVNQGSVSSATVKTGTTGSASVQWTLGASPGTQTLTVTSFKADGTTPLTGSPLTVNATANAKEATSIELVSGDNQSGEVSNILDQSIKVRVKDQYGFALPGTTVNFSVSEGSVSAASNISDINGLAETDWTLGPTVGTQTLVITAFKADGTTPVEGSPMTITATAMEKDAASIVLIAGGGQSGLINSTLGYPIAIEVKDQVGLAYEGATVNFEVSEGSVTEASVTTNNSGRGSISWTLGPTAGTQTLTITAFKNDGITHLDGSPMEVTAEAINTAASDPVTDFDGNVYSTVVIGTKVWMAENLKVTHYADGTAIPLVTDIDTWIALPSEDNAAARAYTYYNFDPASGYGYLYSWVGAMNLAKATTNNPSGVQGVCPDGWHLPSRSEFNEMIAIFGGPNLAGGPVKEEGTTHWETPNTDATNTSGFTALPAGSINRNGVFSGMGTVSGFWSASQNSSIYGIFYNVKYNDAKMSEVYSFKDTGLSVRCVKD